MLNSFIWGILAGVGGTLIGGFIACLLRNDGTKLISILTSFASGIMLSIVFFDLIPLSLNLVGVLYTVLFAGIGILFVLLGKLVINRDGMSKNNLRSSGLLITFAIAFHNLPEGLIIGATETLSFGIVTAILIGLHNVPEGLIMACPMKSAGVKTCKILLACFLSGLPTVIGACLGFTLGSVSPMLIAMCGSGAGGAMLYVVYGELIPSMDKNSTAVSIFGIIGIIVGLLMVFLI